MGLSSPNRMVWQYFRCLRRLVERLSHIQDESERKQEISLCIITAVTVVEAFLNIYFRVIVSEQAYSQHKQRVLNDLSFNPWPKSLEEKLRNWPKDILGQTMDLGSGTPKAFLELKKRRNRLMHFASSHESVCVPGITINGLADSSVFDDLETSDAISALEIAEGMLEEMFRLRGVPPKQIPGDLHLWTGKVPL